MKISTYLSNKALTILITLSLLLFIITILVAPRIDASSDIFLYVKSLPITYWIGLALSTLILVWKGKQSKSAVISSTMLIACFLFALPSIVYVYDPSCRDAYGHMSRALYVIRSGNVRASGVERHPSAYISMAILLIVTRISPLYVMKLYHFFYTLMMALPAYLIATHVSRNAHIAPLAMLGLLWFGSHFGKHTYGYILYGILFLLLIMHIKKPNPSIGVAIILVYGAFTITHPLSSLLVVPITLLYILESHLLKNNGAKFRVSLVLLFITIWCSWYVITGLFIKPIVESLRATCELLTRELKEPTYSLAKYLPTYSAEYLKVIYLRIFSSLLVVITGMILSVVALFRRRDASCLLLATGLLLCLGFFALPWSRLTLANLNRAVEHSLIFYTPLLPTTIGFRKISERKVARFGMYTTYFMLLLFIVLVFSMPVTTFTSSMPSMHIPTTSHKMASFISAYFTPESNDKLNLPDIAIEYHSMLHNNFPLYYKWGGAKGLGELYLLSQNKDVFLKVIGDYRLIAVSHRYFVLDNFYVYNPPFKEFLIYFIEVMDSDSRFDKIYTNSRFYSIYFRE